MQTLFFYLPNSDCVIRQACSQINSVRHFVIHQNKYIRL